MPRLRYLWLAAVLLGVARPRARRGAGFSLPPARRSAAAAAGASHRPRRHRRPLADGAAVPPRRRAPCARRRGHQRRGLGRADPATCATAFEEPADSQRWAVGVRAGVQAYSHIRRDLLHPLGPDGVRPYGELTGEAVLGPFALVSRPAAEPRITDDPEWPGRRDLELAWRMTEAYTPARSSSTAACSTDRWTATGGRSGIEGIGLSDYGYNDTELGLRDRRGRGQAGRHWPAPWRTPATAPARASIATSSPTGSASGSATGSGSASGRPPCSRAPTGSSTGATAIR